MAQTTITFRSREVGDEGAATAFEHPQLTGRAADYAIALLEAGAAGLRSREFCAPDEYSRILAALAAAQIRIGDSNETPVSDRLPRGFDRLDPQRTFEIVEINGRPGIWLAFDRRPASLDDESAWRRVTLPPTAAEAMRKLLGAGGAGIHANEISSRAKASLAQVAIGISPVDSRWPNSFQRLDPMIEWRQAPPFTPAEAYAAPEVPRERRLVVEMDGLFNEGVKKITRIFIGPVADAVELLINAGDAGIHYSKLPASVSYILQTACVPFQGDENTGITRLMVPSPWRNIGDSTPKWSAA